MSELTRLLGRAASNLSHHPVKVRFRKPSMVDALAIAFKLGDVGIIDFHPGYSWDGDELLRVLAHESAHIADLWAEWGDGIPYDIPSGSLNPPAKVHEIPGIKKVEKDADDIAQRWLDYAELNHLKYIQPGSENDEFTLKLRALINYGR